VKEFRLIWGKWEDNGNFRPVEIPAGANRAAFRSSGRRASASGTQGYVVYQLDDDPQATITITITWDVTWGAEKNSVTATTFHEDVYAIVQGLAGRGPVESVTVRVVDGRR
jgi:hypothetical protein